MGALSKLRNTLLAGGAGVAALAAINATVRRRKLEPDEVGAIGGESFIYSWKHADVFYRVAGPVGAPPILFVHDIFAGASSLMWRRNFNQLAMEFRVYALDLPGFGASSKPPTAPYSADFYVECLNDFIRDVVRRPTNIIASGLGAAFTVRLADEQHARTGKLLLTALPVTGASRPGMTGAAFYGLLHSPVLGTSFYNAVTSERSIRDFARKQLFYDRRFATKSLLADFYALSHQPGAQHAIAAFLSGYLQTDLRHAFARLQNEILVFTGKQDELNPVEQVAELVALNPRAQLIVFDEARMWLQEEHGDKFNTIATDALRARRIATA